MANVSPQESSGRSKSGGGEAPSSPAMLLAEAAEAVSMSSVSQESGLGGGGSEGTPDRKGGHQGHPEDNRGGVGALHSPPRPHHRQPEGAPAPSAVRPPYHGYPPHGAPTPPSYRSHFQYQGYPPPPRGYAPPVQPHYGARPPPAYPSSYPPHTGQQHPHQPGGAKYISPQVSFSEDSHASGYKYRTPLRPTRSSGGISASSSSDRTPPSVPRGGGAAASSSSSSRANSPGGHSAHSASSASANGGRGHQIRPSASYGAPPPFPAPPSSSTEPSPSWDQGRDVDSGGGDPYRARGGYDHHHHHRHRGGAAPPPPHPQGAHNAHSPYDYRQPPRWDYGPPPPYDAWGAPPPTRRDEKPTSPFSPPPSSSAPRGRDEHSSRDESADLHRHETPRGIKDKTTKEVSPEGPPPLPVHHWGTPPPPRDASQDDRDRRDGSRADSPSSQPAPGRSTDSMSPPPIRSVKSGRSVLSRGDGHPVQDPFYPPQYSSSYGSLPPPPPPPSSHSPFSAGRHSHQGQGPSSHPPPPMGPPVSPYDHHPPRSSRGGGEPYSHSSPGHPYSPAYSPESDSRSRSSSHSQWPAPSRTMSRSSESSGASVGFLPPPPPHSGPHSQSSFRIGGDDRDRYDRGVGGAVSIEYREVDYDRRPPPSPYGHGQSYGGYPPRREPLPPPPPSPGHHHHGGHHPVATSPGGGGGGSLPSHRQFETPVTRTGQAKFNPPLSEYMSSGGAPSTSSFGGRGPEEQGRGTTTGVPLETPVRKIVIRKKCPWKHYPELEDFLIANREDYLRHSAQNYTSAQRKYNNRLTERLLELAHSHGYVFDETDFDFVTVRDRIRCYYKSYVQSSRKRGVDVVAPYAPEGGGPRGGKKPKTTSSSSAHKKINNKGGMKKEDEERQQHPGGSSPEGGRDKPASARVVPVGAMA